MEVVVVVVVIIFTIPALGVHKLEPPNKSWPACFYIAYEIRMIFTFLNG